MSSAENWKQLFTNWPPSFPRRGLLVNNLNEPTPFKGFLTRGEMVLLERTNPDPQGARYILIGFDAIHSVRFIDPLKESIFAEAGFAGKLASN